MVPYNCDFRITLLVSVFGVFLVRIVNVSSGTGTFGIVLVVCPDRVKQLDVMTYTIFPMQLHWADD